MASLYQITVRWTGFVGAPGYTRMHFMTNSPSQAEAVAAAQDMADFFSAISALLPTDIELTFDLEVPVLLDSTGQPQQFLNLPAQPTITQPTGAGAYAAPAGASVQWLTSAVNNGRRVRGRTYLVPLIDGAYDSVGTLDAADQAVIQTAASTLYNSLNSLLAVFSRPSTAPDNGFSTQVTGAAVADKVAILKSRRDSRT